MSPQDSEGPVQPVQHRSGAVSTCRLLAGSQEGAGRAVDGEVIINTVRVRAICSLPSSQLTPSARSSSAVQTSTPTQNKQTLLTTHEVDTVVLRRVGQRRRRPYAATREHSARLRSAHRLQHRDLRGRDFRYGRCGAGDRSEQRVQRRCGLCMRRAPVGRSVGWRLVVR